MRGIRKLELGNPHEEKKASRKGATKGDFSRSHAPALAVIHKCKRPVIPAWTAGIQSQGGESAG